MHSEKHIRLLQWIQQQAGISRRKAQELVASGEVSIDGEPITDPFLTLNPHAVQSVSLRGHPLATERAERRIYRYHKPVGMLCSHDDPHAGNTVGRVLRAEGFVGYTWAGRLDRDAEGLLVVTNDGDLIQVFSHPRYEVEKTYLVWLRRRPDTKKLGSQVAQMRKGIQDAGETLRIVDGRVEKRAAHARVSLAEGRKHEVKRLFAHFGHDVERLRRISMGPIRLAGLKAGELERMEPSEEAVILKSVQQRLRQT